MLAVDHGEWAASGDREAARPWDAAPFPYPRSTLSTSEHTITSEHP